MLVLIQWTSLRVVHISKLNAYAILKLASLMGILIMYLRQSRFDLSNALLDMTFSSIP